VSHWDSASRWVLVIARFQAKTCAAVPPRIDQRSPLDAASSQEPPVSADDQPEDIWSGFDPKMVSLCVWACLKKWVTSIDLDSSCLEFKQALRRPCLRQPSGIGQPAQAAPLKSAGFSTVWVALRLQHWKNPMVCHSTWSVQQAFRRSHENSSSRF